MHASNVTNLEEMILPLTSLTYYPVTVFSTQYYAIVTHNNKEAISIFFIYYRQLIK